MIIFDEKIYGEKILKEGYQTKRNQGVERCVLIRYLRSLDYDDNQIIKELDKIPFKGREYLERNDVLSLYKRLLSKASKFNYIHDVKINIMESEMNNIFKLDEDLQFLAFVYLVYYKWAILCNKDIFNYKGKKYVIDRDKDIWKLAGLNNLRVKDRYKLNNRLINENFFEVDVFKSNQYFYINTEEETKIIQSINGKNYNNLYYEFMINKDKKYIRCSKCGYIFWRYRGRQKYCEECQDIVKREAVKKSVRRNSKGKYTVYKHVSPNGKIYFGITSREPEIRWNHGYGYSSNKHFTNDISKYGWENFDHIILYKNLDLNEAAKKEKELIKEYETDNPNKGYNITLGGEGKEQNLVDEYGNFYLTVEDKRKKILSLIDNHKMARKIYQPISEEYIDIIKNILINDYDCLDVINMIYLLIYYEFMSDMNLLLEDGFAEIKDNKFYFSEKVKKYLIKLVNNNVFENLFEWRMYEGIFYYKIKNINHKYDIDYNKYRYDFYFINFPTKNDILHFINQIRQKKLH